MISQSKLAQYLYEYLNVATYNDYAPNGVQVEGASSIMRICSAVTASEEVILKAAQWQADALLVHHGYFWRGEDPILVGMKRQRISQLLKHNINLMAYHLPLDCHLELGNNACLAKLLPLVLTNTHKIGAVENLLWSGTLSKPLEGTALNALLAVKLNRKPLHIVANDQPIKTVAWCSGGAQDYIVEAHQLGVDAYISGEVSERTYYQAKELDIHYYACGHHATERYGIKALGEHLASVFNLEHLFIDSDNPV